jgi:hypothetical protein
MSADKIYVDATRPATLRYGQRSVHCFTLQEAKLAWDRLPPEQRRTATIKVADGAVYREPEIRRLHYGPKADQP